MDDAEFIRQNPLFREIEPAHLARLARLMTRQTFARAALLFEKGEPGDTLYLILSGQARVFMRDAHGNEITFRYYQAGDVLGEFAIFDQQPRSAAAAAVDSLETLALRRDDFLKFLHEHPVVGLLMLRTLSERIRYTTLYLEKVVTWTNQLASGSFEQVLAEIDAAGSGEDIEHLIGAFVTMVTSLQQRLPPPNED